MIFNQSEQHQELHSTFNHSKMAPIGLQNFSYCADGTKIFSSYVNDGVQHCGDGSDESRALAPPVPNFQDAYLAIIERLEKMEGAQDSFGSNFWSYVLDLTERVVPFLNSLVLFTMGGKKAHSRFKRRRQAKAAASRPQQQPESLLI